MLVQELSIVVTVFFCCCFPRIVGDHTRVVVLAPGVGLKTSPGTGLARGIGGGPALRGGPGPGIGKRLVPDPGVGPLVPEKEDPPGKVEQH